MDHTEAEFILEPFRKIIKEQEYFIDILLTRSLWVSDGKSWSATTNRSKDSNELCILGQEMIKSKQITDFMIK